MCYTDLTSLEFVDTDAPKDTEAKLNTRNIREGQSVTFNCSSKGRPDPTISWFKNSTEVSTGPTWTVESIDSSHDGQYYCEASNKHGTVKSTPVKIDVQCELILCDLLTL